MNWNNINTDRDTSGLGPIEYDQSKVPSLIRKHADDVRTKTYGQEVREAQARNAEYAGLVANEGNIIAKDASIIAKDTQNRFSDQIAGTTNSDEVIDARRPLGGIVYATLKDRLESLSNTVNVADFGAIGDGVVDDSDAIQNAIDSASENTTIYFPNGIYKLTTPVLSDRSNVSFDGNGSTFLWEGTADLGLDNANNHNRGAIEFKGVETETRNDIQYVQEATTNTVIGIGNTSSYAIGDYVRINIDTGSWAQDYSDYNPNVQTLAEVIDKNDTELIIDYTTPFRFKDRVASGRVYKVNPIFNIGVKNLHIIDKTSSSQFESVPVDEKRSWVNLIFIKNAVNFKASDISGNGHKNKGLKIDTTLDGVIENVKFANPQYVGGGGGYGMQVANSQRIYMKNITGVKNRHLIDFSRAYHCEVENSQDNSSLKGTFDCHGITEHDITFRGVEGGFVFSNGIQDFRSIVENIKIIDSKINDLSIGFVKKLTIKDSVIKNINYIDRIFNLTILNTDILVNKFLSITSTNRGNTGMDSVCNIYNSKINNVMQEFISMLFIDFDKAFVKQNILEGKNGENGLIGFRNVPHLEFNENTIANYTLRLSEGSAHKIKIENNNFYNSLVESLSTGRTFIDLFGQLTEERYLAIKVIGNIFNSENRTQWIRINDRLVGNNISWHSRDNVLNGQIFETVHGDTLLDAVHFYRTATGDLNFSTLQNSKIFKFSL